MIKGLKKLFIGLLIGLPISFVNVSDSTYSVHTVGAYVGSTYQVSVLNQGNVITIYDNVDKAVFSPTGNPIFYWDSDGNANLIAPNFFDCQNKSQFNYYYLCDEIPDNNFTNITNCSKESIDSSFLSSFMGSINSSDNWAYELYTGGNDYYKFNLCFSSKQYNQSLCYFYVANQGFNQWCYQGGDMTGDRLNYNFDTIPSDIIGLSPGVGGSTFDNTPITYEISTGDYVDFYENTYNFNSDMCYVGTRDLSGLFEDRLTYYQGTGYTIFDTFSKIYNTNSYRITDIGGFLGAWYGNYSNWFNGGDHSVIYQYEYGESTLPIRGSELTNPFLNNKAVYYFIGSTFYLSHQTYSQTYDVGLNVAFYCYNKLNNKSNDGSTYDITDDHGYNIDRQVLGDKRYQEAVNGYYSGSSEIVGVNFDGSPLDYFSSGKTYFDTPGQWFDSTFNKFKVSYGQMNPSDLGLGYLPSYIILFFCALVIFRFMSH